MSTRRWKEFRRRRTFPVTRSLATNKVPFCTLKRGFFREIRPLNRNFLECETCRETPHGHVFVESLAKIDPKKVAEVVRRIHDKKQRLCDPASHVPSVFSSLQICRWIRTSTLSVPNASSSSDSYAEFDAHSMTTPSQYSCMLSS